MFKKFIILFTLLLSGILLAGCNIKIGINKEKRTFTNPIVPAPSADPWVIRVGGYYWYTYSLGNAISIKKADRLESIGDVSDNEIWVAPIGENYSKDIWAPELHYINGKWYVYFAADDGNNDNHRMYVLEGGSDPNDPLNGSYKFKGKIFDKTDKWAIDGTVLQKNDGSLYFIWSGWEGNVNGQQNLYIARMSNPWTIDGERVLISMPTYDWEKRGMPINEAPEILKKNNNIYIIYSASGSWTYDYCLGMLTNKDGDVLNPSSWIKTPIPIFKSSLKNKSFGVGHPSFVKSPDGKEDWIVYHAMTGSEGWNARSVRAQRFYWSKDGKPIFGEPVAVNMPIDVPSGEN